MFSFGSSSSEVAHVGWNPVRVLGANFLVQWRRAFVFHVITQNLPLPPRRSGRPDWCWWSGYRKSFLNFTQVLNAVARQGNRFSRGRHARDDVVAPPQKPSLFGCKCFFLALKIAIANLKWALRREIRAPRREESTYAIAPAVSAKRSIKVLARRIRAPSPAFRDTRALRSTLRALGFSKKKIEKSHLRSNKLSEPSIQGDGWRKRIIGFSQHDSSITSVYRQPPSLTGFCWLLLLGTERKLFCRRTGTAWQPSP